MTERDGAGRGVGRSRSRGGGGSRGSAPGRRLAAVCVALSLGLTMGACSAPAAGTPQISAEATVQAYFAAVGAHRWAEATGLLTPSLAKAQLASPDSDRKNTLTLTAVHVEVRSAPFERGAYPGFSDIRQSLVTYAATYREVYGSTDGPQVRFVYVGRQGAAGPWRILEIGTGP